MENKNTISGVLYDKLIVTIRESSWKSLGISTGKWSIFVFSSVSCINPRLSLSLVKSAWFYSSCAIPKIILCAVLVFGFRFWVRSVEWCVTHIRSSFEVEADDAELFYGMYVTEFVDYLFESPSFRRSDVEKRFALSRNKFDEMAKRLDEVGVFVRWENNARVRNPDFSRSDIVSIISRAGETGEIRPLIRHEGGGSYTTRPSMPEIESRLSPAEEDVTWFSVRPISSISAM